MNKPLSEMTMDQLAEAIGKYGDSEAFQRGMMRGRATAKKKVRKERMKAVQLKAFEGK